MHFSTLFNIYNKTIIMEEFDYKKFLVENKLTPNSRLLSERSQIQTNKPLRNLVIQYIKKELPDGKDIEGLFTHEDIAKEYIKKYVTEEEPNYKAVADSDEEMNEWYNTLSYQIQGRESELNEENINVDDDHLLWMNSGNRLADGSGNLVFAKDGDKYFSGSGKISGGEVTRVKNTKEIPQRQYELYLRMWTQVQKISYPPLNEDLDENELNEEFDEFSKEELKALEQYEYSGMFPKWLSDKEGDDLVKKWRKKYEDDFTDPAGGSGLYSHV
jgi:hypothetical protein